MNSSPISSARKSDISALLVTFLIFLAVLLASLCLGAVSLTPTEAFSALFREPDTTLISRVVWYSRLPRILAAVMSGACLAISGCLVQAVLANPLASPGIIGINSGSAFAVTLCCAFLPGFSLPAAAFAGAMLSAMLVVMLGEATGASRLTIVLCGVMLTSLLSAASDAVLSFVPDALSSYTDFRSGSFSGVTLTRLTVPGISSIILILLVVSAAEPLEILTLGSDSASALGLSVRPVRFLFLTAAAALAGMAISVAGILNFVGLITPHIAERLTRSGMRARLLMCALLGALLTVLCDLLSRILFAPYELPVGILLSFIGVPFFLYLLFRQRGGHRHA